MAFKSLKRWLATAALAGGFLLPRANAGQDMVYVLNGIIKQGEETGAGSELYLGHKTDATEGYGTWDTDYSYPSIRSGTWNPKAVTHVEGHDLSTDRRPTNSFTDFNFDLSVIIKDGQNVIGTNLLGAKVYDTASTDYIPTNEHWILSYDINTNYFVEGGAPRTDVRNLRELCPAPNVVYYLTNSAGKGIGINLPVSDTNANGEIVFGTGRFHKEYNQLSSSSTGNGTNNPVGTEILDYNTNKTVSLNAAQDYYVNYYLLTRTDNTGTVTTASNACGPTVSSTNVAIDSIKGSNSIYAAYLPRMTASGIPHTWIREKGLTNFADSVETENADGDIYNNLQEYIADTHPTNEASYFKPLAIRNTDTGALELEVADSSTGRQYTIYGRTNLTNGTWTAKTNSAGNGSNKVYDMTQDLDTGKWFYRGSVKRE